MGLELIPILAPLPIPLIAVALSAGVETALFSLTYQDRLRLKRISPRAANAVAYLLARPRRLLILVLFITMLASTIYFVLTSLALMRSTHPALTIGIGVVNFLLMTLVGEIVSKVLAARYRIEVSRLAAPFVLAAFRATQPIVSFLERSIIAPLARVIVPERDPDALTEEELDALLHLGTREGAIDADERRVMQQVIRLSGLRVRDIMTHRVDMHHLDEKASRDEVIALARETHLTRIPVAKAGDGLDSELVGLLNVKRYLGLAATGAGVSIAECLDPARYVPASASLDKLLEDLRSTGTKVAVAVDEHGGVVGIVTTQDVVQRLIAELSRDEDAEQEARVQLVGLGQWSVPGRLSVKEWRAMFGRAATDDGLSARVSTVAGLVFAKLGRVPRVGDSVTIGNVRVRVDALAGRVVDRAVVSLADRRPRAPQSTDATEAAL